MATEEVKLVFTQTGAEATAQATQDVQKNVSDLNNATTENAAATDNATASGEEWATGLGVVGVAIAASIALTKELVEALIEAGAEWDRQASIMNRFHGDIDGVRERMGGLVTDLELMRISNVASQAGLELTAGQLGDLATAANEAAAATGDTFDAMITKLLKNISSGAPVIAKLGIEIENTGSVAGNQAALLAALAERQDGVTSSADTLGSQYGILQNAMDNATTQFFDALNIADDLNSEFAALQDEVRILTEELFGNSDGWRVVDRVAVATSETIKGVIRAVREMIEAFRAWRDFDIQGVIRNTAQAAMELGRAMDPENITAGLERLERARINRTAERRFLREQRLAEQRGRQEDGGGRGRGRRPQEDPADMVLTEADMEAMLAEQREYEHGREVQRARERGEWHQLRLDAAELEAASVEMLAQVEADRAAAERWHAQQRVEQSRRQLKADAQAAKTGIGLAQQGTDVVMDIFNAGQGEKELAYGAFEVARAIAEAASFNYIGAAGHGIAAAAHFANAAQLGVGGGGGRARGAQAASTSRPGDLPSGVGSQGGGGNVSITLNTPNAVITKADQGRLIRSMLDAVQREGV